LLRTVVARSLDDLDRIGTLWEHLYNSGRHTLFQSFAWNRLAAQYFASREEPYVVAVEGDSGAAIIPAAITDHGVTLLGEALFDYRNVLWTGEANILTCAWREVAKLGLPVFFTALRGTESRGAWAEFGPQPFVNAPCVLAADTNANDFASAHPRLARNLRRLEEQGVEVGYHPAPDPALVRQVYQLKAEHFPGSLFSDFVRVNFMVAAIASGETKCDLFTLTREKNIIAALVTFRDGDTRRFYTIYYDHEWARFSPGVSLLWEVTRQSLADGLNCDYMTGEQPHKMRLATSSVLLFRIDTPWEKLSRIVELQWQAVSELAA